MADEEQGSELAWRVIGVQIADRMAELHLTKAKLIKAAGISDKTLRGYLAGRPITRQDKRWDLCGALRWRPDSIERMLRGEPPAPLPPQAADPRTGQTLLCDPGDDITTAGRSGATLEDLEKLDPEAAAKVRADIEFYLRRARGTE
jgi:hypothetical protein